MSELNEKLASDLMEQRDYLNAAAGAAYRAHLNLTAVLATLEQRVSALETKQLDPAHPLDPNTMSEEQLSTLWDRLWDMSARNEVTDLVETRIADAISDLEVELDDIELSVSVDRANIHLTGKP